MVRTPYPRLPATFNPLGAPHDPTRTPDEGLLRSTTAKRLKPGAPGTKRLQERYGDKLLCVRYGESDLRQRIKVFMASRRP